MDTLIPMEQKGVRRMDSFYSPGFEAKYLERYQEIEFSDDERSVRIFDGKYIHQFRQWLDNLDDELNRRKVLNTNGDHEAPEDIYGAGKISDSVE